MDAHTLHSHFLLLLTDEVQEHLEISGNHGHTPLDPYFLMSTLYTAGSALFKLAAQISHLRWGPGSWSLATEAQPSLAIVRNNQEKLLEFAFLGEIGSWVFGNRKREKTYLTLIKMTDYAVTYARHAADTAWQHTMCARDTLTVSGDTIWTHLISGRGWAQPPHTDFQRSPRPRQWQWHRRHRVKVKIFPPLPMCAVFIVPK